MNNETIDAMLCFDTETGGLNYMTDALCSVTMKVTGIDTIKTWYIKPTRGLNYSSPAMKVNGLSEDFLEKNGITEAACIGEIVSFINTNFEQKPVVLGQNVGFDIDFINQLFIRNNMHSFISMIHHRKRDTQQVSNYLIDCGVEMESTKLSDAYKFFTGEELIDAHTSEADVIATEKLYVAQINYFKERIK